MAEEETRLIAVKVGRSSSSASYRWLDKCNFLYNVQHFLLTGKGGSVCSTTLNPWNEWLLEILKGYEMKDIINYLSGKKGKYRWGSILNKG